MSHYFFEQFGLGRDALYSEIDHLDADVVDVQPDGFNNTIHWHIGHILTVTEMFLFGFPDQSSHLPESYKALFSPGTKPADWGDDVPSVSELVDQLKGQADRVDAITVDQLDKELEEPVMGKETYGGLGMMAVFHETMHMGQIHAMQLAAKAKK